LQKRSELLAELDRFAEDLADVNRQIEKQRAEFGHVKAQLDAELRKTTARIKADEADAAAKRARLQLELEELDANRDLADRALAVVKAELESAERQALEAQ
jgi:hypothetical protein